ncbi:MAG: hypothetical protein JXQ27_18390 [Acidobacteria bacterium]|nr:hypothetical protein [Acidobacteriota bacterium]
MDWVTQAWSEQRTELIVVVALILFILAVIIYVTFFRKRKPRRSEIQIDEIFLQQRKSLPTKEEILNGLVHFSDYPSFITILTEVLNNFSMEYLYTYGELSKAFPRLLDFPKSGNGVSPQQRAAMITMVRVFMTSEFISKKCGEILEENFDRFLEQSGQAG